jgi:opacity protein-like surface antigen
MDEHKEGPNMSRTIVIAAAAIIAGSLSAGDAVAADIGQRAPGGLKDYSRAAVPVPAPVPYEEHYRWYIRGDIGGAITADRPGPTQSGIAYGAGDLRSPLAASAFAFPNSDEHSAFVWGIGAGAYISKRFRMDITADYRTSTTQQITGTYNYVTDIDNGSGTTNWGRATGVAVSGTMSDSIRAYSSIMMVNAYFDLFEGNRFTPYIGAGIGFAHNRWNRDLAIGANSSTCCTLAGTSASSGGGTFSLAANVTAGFSYALSQSTLLDLNYRLMYLQGYEVSTSVPGVWLSTPATGTVDSRLKVGDTWDHQLRAGLRVNLW